MNKFRQWIHHFFIPNKHNNYRAKALHLHFLTGYLIAAVALTFLYRPLTTVDQKVLGVATDITSDKLFTLTNAQRQSNGLGVLTYNDKLSQAALAKAQNMFANNYWAHYGPNGETPWDFILGSGYRYEYAGENLAKDFNDSQGVVNAWMASPTHRANILKPEYKDIGYAVLNGNLQGEETTLVVQMFGTAASTQPLAAKGPETVQAAQPVAVQKVQQPAVTIPVVQPTLGAAVKGQEIVINKKVVTPSPINIRLIIRDISVVFLIILLVALITDFYHAHKQQLVRKTGKHLSQFIFLAFILLSVIIITQGVIL